MVDLAIRDPKPWVVCVAEGGGRLQPSSHVANDGDEEYAGEYDDDDFDDDEEIPPMPTRPPPPVPPPPIRLVARGGGTQPLPPRERILGLTLEDAIQNAASRS